MYLVPRSAQSFSESDLESYKIPDSNIEFDVYRFVLDMEFSLNVG